MVVVKIINGQRCTAYTLWHYVETRVSTLAHPMQPPSRLMAREKMRIKSGCNPWRPGGPGRPPKWTQPKE